MSRHQTRIVARNGCSIAKTDRPEGGPPTIRHGFCGRSAHAPTTHDLRRKIAEYEALETEIEQLRRETSALREGKRG